MPTRRFSSWWGLRGNPCSELIHYDKVTDSFNRHIYFPLTICKCLRDHLPVQNRNVFKLPKWNGDCLGKDIWKSPRTQGCICEPGFWTQGAVYQTDLFLPRQDLWLPFSFLFMSSFFSSGFKEWLSQFGDCRVTSVLALCDLSVCLEKSILELLCSESRFS